MKKRMDYIEIIDIRIATLSLFIFALRSVNTHDYVDKDHWYEYNILGRIIRRLLERQKRLIRRFY
jgi:hypothetical protein